MPEATTGNKIIPVEAASDSEWLGRIGGAVDRAFAVLNDPSNAIHSIGRINETSRIIEDAIRCELNKEPGWKCSTPRTTSGKEQRSGYPDLRLLMEGGKVVFLDPKLYEDGSDKSTLRTFYFEPKVTNNKIHEDARHLLVAVRHNLETGAALRLLSWELVDVSRIRVRLKAEFQASNRDMYREENVVAESSKPR